MKTKSQTFQADLFGWDTTFAISFTKANQAIKNNKSSPSNFELPWPSKDKDNRTLYGSWAPWRLDIGSSGGDILMRCPVIKGDFWFKNAWVPRTKIDVSGIEMTVKCSLTNLDVDQAKTRGLNAKTLVSKNTTGGTTQNLALNIKSNSVSEPAATLEWISWYITGTEKIKGKDRYRPDLIDGIVINLAVDKYPKVKAKWNDGKGNAPMIMGLVKEKFTNYFNQYGLAEFKHIFSAFVVGANTENKKWQWLKPHTISYAVSMPSAKFATLDTCFLGVLALTQPGKTQTASMSQQIDGRIGQVFSNVDSVFAISHELFLDKWILPGVRLAVPNSKSSDWAVGTTGTSISNVKELDIGKMYSNEKKTETTNAKVKAGGWNINLEASRIALDISGVTFNWDTPSSITDDGYKVVAGYKDWYELELKSGKDEKGTPYKNVLHAKQAKNTKPTPTFVLTETTVERWVKLGIEVAVSIIGSMIGGAVAKAIVTPAAAAAEATAITTTDGVSGALTVGLDTGMQIAGDSGETIGTLIVNSGTETASNLTTSGLTEGVTEITTTIGSKIASKAATFLSKMWSSRWIILGSMVGGGIGAVLGDIPKIIENCTLGELSNIATFDDFADTCVDGIEWPGNEAGFQLIDVQLRGALLLGGTLTKTK